MRVVAAEFFGREALFHRAAQQLDGALPVVFRIEKCALFLHPTEGRERDDLKNFLHCADAAGQGDESVRALLHDGFSLRHRLHADELRAMLEKDAGGVEEVRHNADDLPAHFVDSARYGAHHAMAARAEYERVPAQSKLAAERRAERHEVFADLIARRAEYTDIQYPISSSFFR